MQSMPHMQFNNQGFGGGSQLSFGGNNFGTMINNMGGGFQQAVGMADEEYINPMMNSSQIPVYGVGATYNTMDGADPSGQGSSGGNQYMIKN